MSTKISYRKSRQLAIRNAVKQIEVALDIRLILTLASMCHDRGLWDPKEPLVSQNDLLDLDKNTLNNVMMDLYAVLCNSYKQSRKGDVSVLVADDASKLMFHQLEALPSEGGKLSKTKQRLANLVDPLAIPWEQVPFTFDTSTSEIDKGVTLKS